jgi:hypothetical protein
MDCQAGKGFLSKNSVSYIKYDLTKLPSKEDDLIKITGTRIVPTFVFKNKTLLGLMSEPKVLIGFEQNEDEIRKILNINS